MAPITGDGSTAGRSPTPTSTSGTIRSPACAGCSSSRASSTHGLKGTQRLDAPRYTPAELSPEAGAAAPDKVVHVQCAAPTPDPLREIGVARLRSPPSRAGRTRSSPDAGSASPTPAPRSRANAASPRFRGVRDLSVQGDVAPAEVARAFDAASRSRGVGRVDGADRALRLDRRRSPSVAVVTIVLGHAGQPARTRRRLPRPLVVGARPARRRARRTWWSRCRRSRPAPIPAGDRQHPALGAAGDRGVRLRSEHVRQQLADRSPLRHVRPTGRRLPGDRRRAPPGRPRRTSCTAPPTASTASDAATRSRLRRRCASGRRRP